MAVHTGGDTAQHVANGPYPAPPPQAGDGEGDPGEVSGPKLPAGPFVPQPKQQMLPAPSAQEEPGSKAGTKGIAKVGDIALARNRSLRQSGALPGWTDADGGESSVATSGQTVLVTSNGQDAISTDGGNSFTALDPTRVFPNAAGGFCCDQVVAYIPRVHRFVWVLQYRAGSGGTQDLSKGDVVRVASATTSQLIASGGTQWTYSDWTPADFGFTQRCPASSFAPRTNRPFLDRPHIAFTRAHLYLTASAYQSKRCKKGGFLGTAMWRIPVTQLGAGQLTFDWLQAGRKSSKVRPAQGAFGSTPNSAPRTQWFAGAASTSRLDVFEWPDASSTLSVHEVDVPSIATQDNVSNDPLGVDWLSRNSKQAGEVETGAQVGNTLVFGWMTGRQAKVIKGGKEQLVTTHDQPALTFVFLNTDVSPLKRVAGLSIEFDGLAAALPQIRANTAGQLAVGYEYGGPALYPSYAVGFLVDWATALSSKGARSSLVGSGGNDYIGLATDPSQSQCFVGTGSASKQGVPGSRLVPNDYEDIHYVLFGRASAACKAPPLPPVPDLVVDGVTGSPGSIQIVVRNAGAAAAGSSQLAYGFDGGAQSLLDTPALGPGQSTTLSVGCPGPNQVTVAARADATNTVTESNEFNNGASALVTCAATRPDLIVSSVVVGPNNGAISATVKNVGDGAAGASLTRITQDGAPSATLVNTPALAAGAGATVSVACGEGADSATAVADATEVVAESNEANNSAASGQGGSCFVQPG